MPEGLEVRLKGPSFLLSCIDGEPSGDGHVLRLPVERVPPPGPVVVELSFEGYPQHFSIAGTLLSARVRHGETIAEIAVPGAAPELRAALAFVRSAPRAPRSAPRYPLGKLVRVSYERSSRPARIHDVSATGCFLHIPGPRLPEIGARVVLEPQDGTAVDAEVVRAAPLDPRGVGVRFVAASDPPRAQVFRWVTAAMSSTQN